MWRLQNSRELWRLFKSSTVIVDACAGGTAPQCLPAAAAAVLAAQQHSSSVMASTMCSSQHWQHPQQQLKQAVGQQCQQQSHVVLQQVHFVDNFPALPAATAEAAAGRALQALPQAGLQQRVLQAGSAAFLQQHQQGVLGMIPALGQHWLHPWQQWQQQRGLLGVVKHKNYQDHNKQQPKKTKIKTPSMARRRVVVGEDGVMWRMQAGRRHKRYKKSKRRLLGLKGMVPLHGADAAKLRKLGFKKKWWFQIKA